MIEYNEMLFAFLSQIDSIAQVKKKYLGIEEALRILGQNENIPKSEVKEVDD